MGKMAKWGNGESRKSFRPQPPSRIPLIVYLQKYRCVLHRICNITSKLGEDWSNCQEMATVFPVSRRHRSHHLLFHQICVCYMAVALNVRSAEFQPNFVRIGRRLKKWSQFSEVQDSGRCPLVLSQLCVLGITVALNVRFATLLRNLVRIGQLPKEWRQFLEIKVGGSRLLAFHEIVFTIFQLRCESELLLPYKMI